MLKSFNLHLMSSFRGSFSALKHHGERLSDLARDGRPIPPHKLAPRPVTVYNVLCTHFDPPNFTLGRFVFN